MVAEVTDEAAPAEPPERSAGESGGEAVASPRSWSHWPTASTNSSSLPRLSEPDLLYPFV